MPEEIEYCVYDTDEFKAYTALVEKLLRKNIRQKFPDGRRRGLTMKEMHRALGDATIERWTSMALEQIDNLAQDGVPVRYHLLDRPVRNVYRDRKNFTVGTTK